MAHIISCMADAGQESVDLESYTKPASPPPPNESMTSPPAGSCTEKQSFAWRMYQPESRKYQLFPKGGQVIATKGLDPEQAFQHAISQTKAEMGDRLVAATNGLRLRIKEHNLNRRRKISVPELGPMTTVQEAAMDSPTIPGRPALHERSSSAPGTSWKQHPESHFQYQHSPIEEVTRTSESPTLQSPTRLSPTRQSPTRQSPTRQSPTRQSPTRESQRWPRSTSRQPLSPKQLAPLVIPCQQGSIPRLAKQISLTHLRSGSTPVDNPQLRSARTEESLRSRTPLSSASTNMTTSTLPTPVSAPIPESYLPPRPWEGRAGASTPTHNIIERAPTPKTDEPRDARAVTYGHRRGVSESGSIVDRGRPKKRIEHAPIHFTMPTQKTAEPKRSRSAERRAFEQLPKGWKACEASKSLSPTEISDLQKQAFGQAARFEVLRKEDVEALSRELRHLDERTEYLRRTYTSLRAGRRNLHSRICQYLRSPRVAKFSYDSMLKQEEALAELDSSIDDWVTKLERAENRRTRVRQKLLEHVAAAATLPDSSATAASESLQFAMGVRPPQQCNGVGNISTPPRSPTKASFTPAIRTGSISPAPHRVVAQVPSTILEQPLVEEAAALKDGKMTMSVLTSRDCESIRVYADSDVYALLADVESEFTKMSAAAASLSDTESRELQRARSHDLLCGTARPDSPTRSEPESRAPSPPAKDDAPHKKEVLIKEAPVKEAPVKEAPVKVEPVMEVEAPIYLTSAVFRPTPPPRSLAVT